jgi:phage gpG-like protein
MFRSTFKYDRNDNLLIAIATINSVNQHLPQLGKYILYKIAKKTLQKSKRYLRGQEEPYQTEWEPLWYKNSSWGGSTLKFHKSFESNGVKYPQQRKKNVNGFKPLHDTDALARSLKILDYSDTHISIGSTLKYAAIHEFGGQQQTNNWGLQAVPARPYLAPAIYEVMEDEAFKKRLASEIGSIVRKAFKTGKLEVPKMSMLGE